MFSKIKQTAFVFFTFVVFSLNAQGIATWKIDKSHTSINFSINHFFSAVTGKFKDFDGEFYFDKNNLKESQVNFSIVVKSIDTDNSKRDTHLLSKDFFNSNMYPKMSFRSTDIDKKSDNEYVVRGKLTIRDVTKEVVLPMKITGQIEHPMMKDTLILGVLINTTINRTGFGVGVGNWAATKIVGDTVKINIPMELNRKK